jgi:nucleotide-binding universal stress UspA family protein
MSHAATTIVVGVDGSEGSLEALIWAIHHARRAGLPLKVVTVTEIPAVYTAVGLPGLAPGSTFDDLVVQGMEINARAVDDAKSFDLGIAITGEAVVGTPVVSLVEATQPGDVLVVSASSHHRAMTDLLGSVATGVAHRAHGPVIVVHGTVPHDAPLRRIVVGVDGWDESKQALEWACVLAEQAAATIELVHGWEYPYRIHDTGSSVGTGSGREGMQRDARALADGVLTELSAAQRRLVTATHVIEGPIAEVVIEAAADADLLVVGSRGRGGLRSLLLGSVSRKVVQHASCAVAVVPSLRVAA